MIRVMHVTFNANSVREAGKTIEFRGYAHFARQDGFLIFEYPGGEVEAHNMNTVDSYMYSEEDE